MVHLGVNGMESPDHYGYKKSAVEAEDYTGDDSAYTADQLINSGGRENLTDFKNRMDQK